MAQLLPLFYLQCELKMVINMFQHVKIHIDRQLLHLAILTNFNPQMHVHFGKITWQRLSKFNALLSVQLGMTTPSLFVLSPHHFPGGISPRWSCRTLEDCCKQPRAKNIPKVFEHVITMTWLQLQWFLQTITYLHTKHQVDVHTKHQVYHHRSFKDDLQETKVPRWNGQPMRNKLLD